MATSQVNYNDSKNYKPCRKKQYEIWACKPPVGTIVINKLEQGDIVRQLRGKTYFTVEELEKMRTANPQMYAQLAQMAQQSLIYCVGENDGVLSGTRGELWVTRADKIARIYQVMYNGGWSSNWSEVVTKRSVRVAGHQEMCFQWAKIRSVQEKVSGTFACFVPLAQKGQIRTSWAILNFNSSGVEHGLGDFIVCCKGGDGKPNLNDRWVVNGAVFADTYNNQGWQGTLKTSGVAFNTPMPAPLFK